MVYFLMHENIKIAVFEVDENYNILRADSGNDDKIIKWLPVGVYDRASLKKWIASRGVPITRQGIQKELGNMGVASVFELMLRNNGISLTDHYWIKKVDDGMTWEEVNPYENSFHSVFQLDMDSDMQSIAGKTNFTPSASLQGDLKKKWIIDEHGVRRMVKGNRNDGCRQSLCEVLATEIHCMQDRFSYVPYSLIKITSNGKAITG